MIHYEESMDGIHMESCYSVAIHFGKIIRVLHNHYYSFPFYVLAS